MKSRLGGETEFVVAMLKLPTSAFQVTVTLEKTFVAAMAA